MNLDCGSAFVTLFTHSLCLSRRLCVRMQVNVHVHGHSYKCVKLTLSQCFSAFNSFTSLGRISVGEGEGTMKWLGMVVSAFLFVKLLASLPMAPPPSFS